MTKYQKAAQKALEEQLRGKTEPIVLFDVSCIMDEAARAAGKKQELFRSLWDYADYLPAGWTTDWLTTSDSPTADSMAYAVPPGWQGGQSDNLLLGPGRLRRAKLSQLTVG